MDNAKVYARLGGVLYHQDSRCYLVTSAISGELYMPIDIGEALRRELVPCTVCIESRRVKVEKERKHEHY